MKKLKYWDFLVLILKNYAVCINDTVSIVATRLYWKLNKNSFSLRFEDSTHNSVLQRSNHLSLELG